MLKKQRVFTMLLCILIDCATTMAWAQTHHPISNSGISTTGTVPEQMYVSSSSATNSQSIPSYNNTSTTNITNITNTANSGNTGNAGNIGNTANTTSSLNTLTDSLTRSTNASNTTNSTNTINSPNPPPTTVTVTSSAPPESFIPRVIPRFEPLSRYGNPASYMVSGKIYTLRSEKEPYHETGIASWYGPGFHRLRTSSGETYDMHSMTAAHKTLPIPCYVKVKNLQNGKEITVRVNDRGPFHEGRIIDLSYAAAKELGVVGSGTAMVDVSSVEITAERSNTSENASSNTPYNLQNYSANVQQAIYSSTNCASLNSTSSNSATSNSASSNSTTSQAISSHENQFYLQLAVFSQPESAEKLRTTLQPRVPEPIKIESKHIGDKLFYAVILGPVVNHERADTLSGKLVAIGYNKPMVFMN